MLRFPNVIFFMFKFCFICKTHHSMPRLYCLILCFHKKIDLIYSYRNLYQSLTEKKFALKIHFNEDNAKE